MRLIAFETQFTSVLHPGSRVSCHNFLILLLYFNNRSRRGISLFNSDKVILLVDILYAVAMEAVNAHAALTNCQHSFYTTWTTQKTTIQ
jgi:hypothetical protein